MSPERLRAALAFLAIVALGFAALHWRVFDAADRKLADFQFRLLRERAPQAVARDVVLVGVDESTYRSFNEPFALWHPHLGNFLKAMAVAKPAVVGLDIVLPDKSYHFLIPNYDRPLLEGLAALRGVTPVVLAQSLDEHGNQRTLFPPFVSLVGRDALGSVAVCRDPDLIVRRFDESDCRDSNAMPTLAGRMAKHLGIEQQWSGIIDYAAGDAISYVPLQEVLAWAEWGDVERLRAVFGGKPVLLGVILPYSDRHPLPVSLAAFEPESLLLPGVLIHVQALRSMMHRGLIQPLVQPAVALLALLALAFWFGRSGRLKSALLVLAVAAALAGSMWMLWKGIYLPGATLALFAVLGFLARLAYDARGQIRERRFLRDAFGSYVSPQILKEILRGRIAPGVAGKRQRICVMVCALPEFAPRADGLPAEDVVALLNECFSAVTQAIYKHGGTTNKFLGDSLLAFFGAPQRLPNPEKSALEASQDMLEGIEQLNERLVAQDKSPIAAAIGIHSGNVVLGHVGSASHHEYTAIGQTVDIAWKLQSLARELGYPVLCSVPVADGVGRVGDMQDLGMRPLPGHEPLQLFGWQPPALVRSARIPLTPQEVPS